jgi:hypothetical protein
MVSELPVIALWLGKRPAPSSSGILFATLPAPRTGNRHADRKWIQGDSFPEI